jgi:hypothetical protein
MAHRHDDGATKWLVVTFWRGRRAKTPPGTILAGDVDPLRKRELRMRMARDDLRRGRAVRVPFPPALPRIVRRVRGHTARPRARRVRRSAPATSSSERGSPHDGDDDLATGVRP